MTAPAAIEVPVLIVGAGPAGLCASILLSRFGVESLTVERHPGTSIYPRATGINVRTMEIFRSLGLEQRVRHASFKACPRISRAAVLVGPDLDSSPAGAGRPDVSPAEWTSCAQSELEPILLQEASSHAHAQLMFGTQLLEFDSGPEGITALIADRATGRVRTVRCQYLVGADGSKSAVRERAGIKMRGIGVLDRFVGIHFKAPLRDHLPRGADFLCFVQNDDVSGIFAPTDDELRWVFNVRCRPDDGKPAEWFTPERATELVRKGAGLPGLAVDVVGLAPWSMQADSAERWRGGNVFLAGDSAHRMTPLGGLGLNTAVQDVHNLCWKLAAVLQGWAGPELLDSYEVERRPVAHANLDRSVSLAGDAGTASSRTRLDFDLGFRYASSAIVADGTEPSQRIDGDYEATARPGSRAPHMWFRRGRDPVSILDLFGPRFTLLAGRRGRPWLEASTVVADELAVPLRALTVPDASWNALYGVEVTGAVLIRPDGHVAWRRASAADSPTVELRRILEMVLSAGSDTSNAQVEFAAAG